MQISKAVFRTGCALFAVEPSELSAETGPRNMSHGETHGAVYVGEAHGRSFVLKFSPITAGSIADKRDIYAFIAYLGQNGVRVPAPLPSSQGNFVEIVEDGDSMFAVTKTEKVSGEHLDRFGAACDDAFFNAWGRAIGKMHALTQHYPVNPAFRTWKDEGLSFANMCQDEAVLAKWNEVNAWFDTLPQTPDAYGIIHNDPHPENLLLNEQEVILIDFDASHCHWFMIDISIPVFCAVTGGFRSPDKTNMTPDQFTRHFFEHFMAGYTQEHQLDRRWLHHMPMFLKHRRILPFILYAEQLKTTNQEYWQQWRNSILNYQPLIDPTYWANF